MQLNPLLSTCNHKDNDLRIVGVLFFKHRTVITHRDILNPSVLLDIGPSSFFVKRKTEAHYSEGFVRCLPQTDHCGFR
jgi:hypothetical protein